MTRTRKTRIWKMAGAWAAASVLLGGLAGAGTPAPIPAAPIAVQQSETVEALLIEGNDLIAADAWLAHLTVKPGDPVDREALRAEFQTLWNTGFADDMRLELRDGPGGGKLVVFVVHERPRVATLEFVGSEELDNDDILEKLEEEDSQIAVGAPYDPDKVVRAREVIEEMLVDKGRTEGAVTSSITEADAGVQIVFNINDEQQIRIRRIQFEGVEALDEWPLRWSMKKTRESHPLGALLGGSTYTEEQYAEDIEAVRQEYLKRGYLDVSFGPPEFEYEDGFSRQFLFWKRAKRWMDVTIPVVEGEQYRVGEVTVEGAAVFPAEVVRTFFPILAGEVYDESKVNKGLESLREVYGARGYVQFTGFPTWHRRPEGRIVDVVINLAEEDQFLVNRIEFRGNSTTKDRVIRREMWLNEQDIMNMELLKASIQRINQLGYFRPIEQPAIEPSPEDETKLDITLDVVEENRNQLTFGAGVSGLEGLFVNASFGTTNFLGRGETANFSIQTGSRTQNYQIAITDPYFMDKPITLGFDVFSRVLKLREFTRGDIGGRIVFGVPLGRWSRAFLNYGYSVITVSEPDPDIVLNLYDLYYNSTYLDPRFYGLSGNFRESKISPTLVHNTVDHPIFPSRGKKATASFDIAGGALGGNVHYLKPTLELVRHMRVIGNTSLGLRVMGSYLHGYAGTPPPEGQEIDIFNVEQTGVPYYNRFFLGGEYQIRGYYIRSVGPRNARGQLLGGNKMLLFNAEYAIPLAGPLRAILFFDAGNAFAEEQNWSLSMLQDFRTSTGIEMRVFIPMLNVPFRLIFAYNPHRDYYHRPTAFVFGIGTTF